MNQRPPQPLDAEERALAALLPRPQGRTEPGAELDARILASAQAALRPQAVPRHPHRSWIAPTAVAASLMLAVGLAWQLRPPASLEDAAPAAASASAESDAAAVRAFEAPPVAMIEAPTEEDRQMKPMPPPAAPPPPARVARAPAPPAEPEVGFVAPPPPPPAPPAPVIAHNQPAAPAVAGAAVAAPQMTEQSRMAAPALAKSARTTDPARERAATGNPAARAQTPDEAAMAADATTLDTITSEDPGEDVPPATADSPEVRDAWLRRVAELLKQGKREEAKASLAEFRRRYPDATLPLELRKLEP